MTGKQRIRRSSATCATRACSCTTRSSSPARRSSIASTLRRSRRAIAARARRSPGSCSARLRERRLAEGARLLAIGVPPEVDPDGALLLWSALHDLLRPRLARFLSGQPQLAWEIAAGERGQPVPALDPALGPARPGRARARLRLARRHHHRRATARRGSCRDGGGERAARRCELVLSGPDWFPLGGRERPDPLRLVLGQLADLADDEQALVQIVARPATAREQRRLLAAARRIRAGVPPRAARPAARPRPARPAGAAGRSIRPSARRARGAREGRAPALPLPRPARPSAHPRTRGRARPDPRARRRLRRLRGPRRAAPPPRASAPRASCSCARSAAAASCSRSPSWPRSPTCPASARCLGCVRAGARSVAPPPGLPASGKPLGRAARGEPVALAVADARYHLHLLGPTGVGKSTLIARLVLADLAAGRGAVVIDPKGDLVEEILARIPAGPSSSGSICSIRSTPRPPGLNVLEGADHDLVVDQLVGIFRRVYERFWGPRTDDILRAALLTLLETGAGATLADVPRLLTDARWREQLLAELDDPVGLEPFWEWYDSSPRPIRAQATGPVLNKLRAFLLRRPVRAIVGQEQLNDRRRPLPRPGPPAARPRAEGHARRGHQPAARLLRRRPRLAGSARPRRPRPSTSGPTAPSTSTRCTTTSTCPPRSRRCSPRRAATGSRSASPTSTSASCRSEMREAIAANARTKLYFQLSPQDAHTLGTRGRARARRARPRPPAAPHGGRAPLPRGRDRPAPSRSPPSRSPLADPERAEAVRADSRARNGTERERGRGAARHAADPTAETGADERRAPFSCVRSGHPILASALGVRSWTGCPHDGRKAAARSAGSPARFGTRQGGGKS